LKYTKRGAEFEVFAAVSMMILWFWCHVDLSADVSISEKHPARIFRAVTLKMERIIFFEMLASAH
jgi:hypothetical protein